MARAVRTGRGSKRGPAGAVSCHPCVLVGGESQDGVAAVPAGEGGRRICPHSERPLKLRGKIAESVVAWRATAVGRFDSGSWEAHKEAIGSGDSGGAGRDARTVHAHEGSQYAAEIRERVVKVANQHRGLSEGSEWYPVLVVPSSRARVRPSLAGRPRSNLIRLVRRALLVRCCRSSLSAISLLTDVSSRMDAWH